MNYDIVVLLCDRDKVISINADPNDTGYKGSLEDKSISQALRSLLSWGYELWQSAYSPVNGTESPYKHEAYFFIFRRLRKPPSPVPYT